MDFLTRIGKHMHISIISSRLVSFFFMKKVVNCTFIKGVKGRKVDVVCIPVHSLSVRT